MDLEQWRKRKAEGEPFDLPSGLTVHLRRMQLLDLVERGQIPTPLVSVANDLLVKDTVVSVQNFEQAKPVIDLVTGACLAGPEGLDVDELTVADRLAIWNWSNEILVAVTPFREERSGDGAA